jgi:hypothetical protein
MVMLDEWDKTRPSADGFFLDFLQYGRLSIPGMDVEAKLSNMLIFITANDEREFHEALLRRFPKIDVQPLKPRDVVKALSITHNNHPYMSQMIDLYCRSIAGHLPKPATIQELRQLMDAIDVLGDGADWDTLVYQYVTKTPENHDLLSNTAKVEEGDYANIAKNNKTVINADNYGVELSSDGNMDEIVSKMPELRRFETEFVTKSADINMKEVFSVFERNKGSDNLVFQMHMDDEDPVEPAFTEWSTITDDVVYLHQPTRAIDASYVSHKLEAVRDDLGEGEVMFSDTYITRKELNRMLAGKWYVHKRSKHEIIARRYVDGCKVDLRWSNGDGIEVVINIKAANRMAYVFKFNKDENLVLNEAYDVAHKRRIHSGQARSLNPIGMFDMTRLVAGNMVTLVKERGYRKYGPSQIKALSEHDSYCDMTMLGSPTGSSANEDEDIDYEPIASCTKLNICNMKGYRSVEFTANNVEIALSDTLGKNGARYLRIDGYIKGAVASAILSWFHTVPIYRCFKYEHGLMEKLLRAGWTLHRFNFECLEKNGVYARFVYDYVVFVTFVHSDDVSLSIDDASLALLFRSKIKRIAQLERAYDPNKR